MIERATETVNNLLAENDALRKQRDHDARLIYQLRFEANSNLTMALDREILVRKLVAAIENEGKTSSLYDWNSRLTDAAAEARAKLSASNEESRA